MVTEDEKKMPVLEDLHSALISSDESDEEGSQNKAPRVEIRGGFHVFFTIWTLAIEEVCPTSKKRQSVNRRVGPPSTRDCNEVPESLLWAIKL